MRGTWTGALALLVLGGCGDDAPPALDGATLCAADTDCDDGLFCNGVENCDPTDPSASPRGCVPAARPCMADQTCDEMADACLTICERTADADGDGSDAIECGGNDCDDADPNRYPENLEVCDGANHDEDCDPETFGDRDIDGDGEVDARCCNGDRCGTDCDDLNASIAPGTTEACDGFDNDCDGSVDEEVLVSGFADEDGDGRGDPSAPLMACPDSPRFSIFDDDCDDADLTRNGAQVEICDAKDNDCDETVDESPTAVPWYRDGDGDSFGNASGGTVLSCAPVAGHSLLGTDCDDERRGVSPVGVERCNGRDDDCNGVADFVLGLNDTEDDDGDGEPDAACVGVGSDCSDDDRLAGPAIPELCEDGVDNDCDGLVDEDAPAVEWRIDLDGDGFGDDVGDVVTDCRRQPGRAPRGGDCDDSSSEVRPTNVDGCDGVDEDCDGTVDEDATDLAFYEDRDGDGFGSGEPVLSCRATADLSPLATDCDDANAARNPGAVETCDGFDEDCDEVVDEGALRMVYADADGDGFGDDAMVTMACAPGDGETLMAGDCDDTSASVFPMADEVCNGADEDCDGTIDEGGDAACTDGGTMAACTAGSCVITGCAMGFADCDGLATNGCERDVTSDTGACGGCATECAIGATCSAGTCSSDLIDVSAGSLFTCALWANGTVVCWGVQNNGRLGTTGVGTTSFPVTNGVTTATRILSSAEQTCAETSTGWQCWGEAIGDTSAQWSLVGDGVLGPRTSPTPMAVPGYLEVDTGVNHACGVRPGGTVHCWGVNNFGQLGDGTTTHRTTPVTVLGVTDAVDVAVGRYHTCALRSGGTVTCWGRGNVGELGDTQNLSRSQPVFDVSTTPGDPTASLTGVTDVAATQSGACALTSGGEVWCWGGHVHQAFGSTGERRVATRIQTATGPLDGVVAIDAGGQGYCALREVGSDRTLWCWGTMLTGDGSTTTGATLFAIQVAGITDVDRFALGNDHGIILRQTDDLVVWGRNDPTDRLGIGVTTDAYTPTATVYIP